MVRAGKEEIMTQDELRKIDQDVAVKVMGWRWWAWSKKEREGYGHPFIERIVRTLRPPTFNTSYWEEWAKEEGNVFRLADGTEQIERIQGTSDAMRSDPLPEFSSDMAAAATIVTEMRRQRWKCMMDVTQLGYGVLFYGNGVTERRMEGDKSWPLAICKAALAAVEEQRAKQ